MSFSPLCIQATHGGRFFKKVPRVRYEPSEKQQNLPMGYHLGLKVLFALEADVFLDGGEVDLPLHQLLDDLDHLAPAAAQAGQFADDQTVPRCQRVQQFVAAPLVQPLGPGVHRDPISLLLQGVHLGRGQVP